MKDWGRSILFKVRSETVLTACTVSFPHTERHSDLFHHFVSQFVFFINLGNRNIRSRSSSPASSIFRFFYTSCVTVPNWNQLGGFHSQLHLQRTLTNKSLVFSSHCVFKLWRERSVAPLFRLHVSCSGNLLLLNSVHSLPLTYFGRGRHKTLMTSSMSLKI